MTILGKIKAIGSQEEISSLYELLKEERQALKAEFVDLVRKEHSSHSQKAKVRSAKE